MKRFISIFLSLAIVLSMVCLVAPSASAVEIIDYNDYITNISVDGDNDIVTFDIPLTYTLFGLYQDGELYATDRDVTGFSAMLYGGFSYTLNIWVRSYISLDNIPDGTEFTVKVTCDSTFTGGYNNPPVYGVMQYYSTNVQRFVDLGVNPMDGTYTYNLTPDKTYGNEVMFGLWFHGFSILNEEDSELYTWYLNSISCTMSISSLYRLQQATEKTNEILKAVEDKLEEQGKTLQDILDKIDSEADPVAPDGSDDVTDTVDKEDQMVDDAVSDYNDNGFVFTDADTFVGDIWTPVLACSALLSDFIDNNDWLRGMLLIAIAFLVLKLIFSGLNNLDNNTSKKEGDE